ncbi:hypothetical protein JTB14_034680 [Gonioctena quinquepunctata]|nr:hypothetical protein JTB14_034680 [Gonioctena quinquepunctata]
MHSDQPYRRILSTCKPTQALQEYQSTTLTYGNSSAPFLAIRTFQSLANDKSKIHSEAANLILGDLYVDDVLSGSNILKNDKNLRKNLSELLKKGRFTLREWSSNSPEFRQNIPEGLEEESTTGIGEEEAAKKSLVIL